MTPLVIVPARAGSKGVPNKNFAQLPDGSTLLDRAVAIGIQIGHVVLTSDINPDDVYTDLTQEQIVKASKHLPQFIQRPKAIAQDDTPMRDVVAHVLDAVPGPPDQPIVLLQPTTPLRTVEQVRQCLKAAKPCAASVRAIPWAYWRSQTLTDHYIFLPKTRRQDAMPRYIFSGECYVFPRVWGLNPANSFRAVMLDSEPYVNVDQPSDWEQLCEIIRRGQITAS